MHWDERLSANVLLLRNELPWQMSLCVLQYYVRNPIKISVWIIMLQIMRYTAMTVFYGSRLRLGTDSALVTGCLISGVVTPYAGRFHWTHTFHSYWLANNPKPLPLSLCSLTIHLSFFSFINSSGNEDTFFVISLLSLSISFLPLSLSTFIFLCLVHKHFIDS